MAQDPAGTGASLDTLAGHRAGRATALTTLTPLPRFWSPPLKLLLRFKTWVGPDKTLRRLSFIHAAYWVMLDGFPGEQRRTRYSYLLFVSNFNGSWFDYIDVFARIVPQKMVLLWGSSFGFPGPNPPRGFTRYIRANDRPLEHYYAAYPGATTTEIASALRVGDQFDARLRAELATAHRATPALATTPAPAPAHLAAPALAPALATSVGEPAAGGAGGGATPASGPTAGDSARLARAWRDFLTAVQRDL